MRIQGGKALISQQPLLDNLSFWPYFRQWWIAENERAGADPDYASICCAEAGGRQPMHGNSLFVFSSPPAQMNSPNLADLIVMMLFNGSDAASAVAYAILPVLFQHLLHGFQSLASEGGQPTREASDARRLYDVQHLESIVLSMQNDSQSATVGSEFGGFSCGLRP